MTRYEENRREQCDPLLAAGSRPGRGGRLPGGGDTPYRGNVGAEWARRLHRQQLQGPLRSGRRRDQRGRGRDGPGQTSQDRPVRVRRCLQGRRGADRRAAAGRLRQGALLSRADLFQCGGAGVRDSPEAARRRHRHRTAVSVLHRHRDQVRSGQDLTVGLPQCGERARHVRPRLQAREGEVSRAEDGGGGVRVGLRPFGIDVEVRDVVEWWFEDTEFGVQAAKLRKTNADILVMMTHTFTTCGAVKEFKRQRVKAKLMVGITSAASTETLVGCGQAVEGLIIPTNFAAISPKAKALADKAWAKYKADSNLHSVPAYENVHAIRGIVEKVGIKNEPATLLEDRRKVRDALAGLGTFQGVLGPIKMNGDDDPVKPRDVDKAIILVQAKGGQWTVFWQPPELEKK